MGVSESDGHGQAPVLLSLSAHRWLRDMPLCFPSAPSLHHTERQHTTHLPHCQPLQRAGRILCVAICFAQKWNIYHHWTPTRNREWTSIIHLWSSAFALRQGLRPGARWVFSYSESSLWVWISKWAKSRGEVPGAGRRTRRHRAGFTVSGLALTEMPAGPAVIPLFNIYLPFQ